MPLIVSSTLTVDNVQVDGRRVVVETHIDDGGNQYQISYMASADTDLDAHLAQSAISLNNQVADGP